MKKSYSIAVLTSHPIQNQVSLWRMLAKHPQIDLFVYFCSDYGVTEKIDPGFGVKFKWNIPLLDGYRYKFLRNYSPKKSLDGFFALVNFGIIKKLIKHRYDGILIHSYAYATNFFTVFIAKIIGTKILIRSESNTLLRVTKWRKFLKQIILPTYFKLIDSFVAIGYLNHSYYWNYHVPDEKINYMPYAVDNEWFFAQSQHYLPNKRELKEQIGISPNSKIILCASKFLKRKRQMDLIQAFEQIIEPDTALIMIGDGEEKICCENYVKTGNIKNVYFTGFKNQSELPKFYSLADIFVLPSENEPWGLVVNEAMCFGLPVVTTNQVGSSYDLLQHGKNGYVYRVGDIKALKVYLEAILNDDELRNKMGKYSIELIKNWGLEEDLKGLREALNSL